MSSFCPFGDVPPHGGAVVLRSSPSHDTLGSLPRPGLVGTGNVRVGVDINGTGYGTRTRKGMFMWERVKGETGRGSGGSRVMVEEVRQKVQKDGV